MARLLYLFIQALPDLIQLLKILDARIEEAKKEEGVQRKIGDDIKVINSAFAGKDAAKLNDLFNSK